jgi:hypothetical protein
MFRVERVTTGPPDYDQSKKSKHIVVIHLYNLNGVYGIYMYRPY